MTSTREDSRMSAADVYYNFINIGKKGTEDKNKIPQSTLEPPPSLPTEEVSTTPTTPSRSALEVYRDSLKQPEIPQETFDDIAYTEPESPPVEKADFKPSLMWPAHPTTPSEMDREEYDVTKTPILSDKFKKDFMGTLQRFWRAAQRPDEILAGTAEFVSALPGFGAAVLSAIGTIPLEIGDRIIKDKSFNILDLYNASSKSFDKIMGDWHEYVSGPIGQVIMGPRRAGEYLGKGMTEILGGEYTKPDEGYDPGLVGEIAMAPFTAVHEPLQKLSDHPVLDDLPNIKGLFKFTTDIAALLVAHRVYKGGKDKLTADVNEEAVRIKKLADLVDEIEKLKEQGADENVIRASQEVAKIQKTQAKLRDEEIAKNMQYDQIIKEDLTSKTKRIKKVKQPKKDILDEQIDKAMQKLPDEVKPITEEIKTVEKPELGETVEEKKSKKVSKPTEVSKPEVKPEPPSDLDLQTGTRQPIELSTEKSPFRQEPERTAFMNKWFSENKWDSSVEMIASKLINDINSWLDGKDVDITKVRDGLSDFSVMLDNPTYESLLLDTFYSDPVRVNNFKDMVSEAAIWARKADRSKIGRSKVVESETGDHGVKGKETTTLESLGGQQMYETFIREGKKFVRLYHASSKAIIDIINGKGFKELTINDIIEQAIKLTDFDSSRKAEILEFLKDNYLDSDRPINELRRIYVSASRNRVMSEDVVPQEAMLNALFAISRLDKGDVGKKAKSLSDEIEFGDKGVVTLEVPYEEAKLLNNEYLNNENYRGDIKLTAEQANKYLVRSKIKRSEPTTQLVDSKLQSERGFPNEGALGEVTLKMGISPGEVWQGSKAIFDKVKNSMIGTGEGAQAFGYGHYFSSSFSVAKWYAEAVGRRGFNIEASCKGKKVNVPLYWSNNLYGITDPKVIYDKIKLLAKYQVDYLRRPHKYVIDNKEWPAVKGDPYIRKEIVDLHKQIEYTRTAPTFDILKTKLKWVQEHIDYILHDFIPKEEAYIEKSLGIIDKLRHHPNPDKPRWTKTRPSGPISPNKEIEYRTNYLKRKQEGLKALKEIIDIPIDRLIKEFKIDYKGGEKYQKIIDEIQVGDWEIKSSSSSSKVVHKFNLPELELLDLDKPIPEAQRDSILTIIKEKAKESDEYRKLELQLSKTLLNNPKYTGMELINGDLRRSLGKVQTSKLLREAGIHGDTYSGGASGKRNFVIFDELDVPPVSETIQLNMMIPLDQAPKAVIDLAKEAGILFKDIFRNKEIFDKTGFWFNRHDRKWMYELDDSKVRFKASATAIDALKAGQTVGLQKVIDYPELFEAVPKLKETLVRVRPDIGGAYHGKGNIISLKSMEDILAPLEGRKSLLHEINHAVRDAAGLKEVGSSTAIALADRVDKIFSELIVRAKTPEIASELDKIWKQTEDSVFNGKGPIAISNEIVTEVSNVLRIDISKAHTAVRKFLDSGHILKDYKTNVGEVESRLVQRRANMTAEERRAKLPWDDMDEMMAEERLKARPDQKLYDIIGATIEGAEQLLKLAKEVPKYTKSAKGMKKFKPKEAAEMLREEFTRTFIDRSGNIRRELIDTLGEDGYKIVQQSALSAGSNSWSSSLLQQMYKEIDSGLTRREKSIRDDLLLCMRIKDIANYKTEKQFHYPEGLRPEIATAYIEMFGTLEKLNAEQIALIKQSASSYIEWMKKPLRDLLEHGLITEEEFKQLEAHDYRRLRKVEDIFDRKHKTKVGKKSRSIYDSGVQHLQRGHKTDILEPNSSIMALEVFNRTYGRIFNNEANKALLELARRDPENSFAREKKPVGWSTIYVYEEGVRKPIYISSELAKEWAMRDAEISYKAAKILRYASMSPVLRTFATGVNWAFAMANLPRDVMHAWYASRIYEDGKWKSVYSPHMPIAAIQMSWDLGSTFTDALLRKGRYIDYLEEGGGMEFLVHQGRVFRKGRHIEGPLDKIENFLGYFGETTEVMTRLSIRDRVIKKRASEQGLTLEEARKNPEITREATFAARDYMDFAQGGKFTKAADNAIPYLNATVVATRGMFRSFKPGSGTALANTYKLAQFAGAVTALYIASQKLASETHDELKGNPATKSNLCIPLGDGFGFEDEHGQKRYIYFKVPLDPSQKFFKTFFEACADKWRGQEVDVDRVTDTLTEMAPVDISSLPPSVSALLGYATNKDFWRNEDIWRGTNKAAKYQLPKIITGKPVGGSEEEYGTRTPEMYKDIGKYTGLSPERIEYAIGEIITNDNMWADLLGRGYEAAFKDVPESKREMHLAEVLAKLPVIKRFIGITNPSHRYGEVIDEKRSAYEIGRFVQNRGLDLRMEGYLFDKNVEKKEVVDYMKSFKDLDTFNRLKERYIFQVKTKELPNFVFWRRLQGLAPEPRAEVFAKRWDEATPQQRSQMKKEIQTVIDAGGVITDDFRSELTKIRLQSLKDVTEK